MGDGYKYHHHHHHHDWKRFICCLGEVGWQQMVSTERCRKFILTDHQAEVSVAASSLVRSGSKCCNRSKELTICFQPVTSSSVKTDRTLSLCALTEVQIKVQVFDNSDLSPLADAHVEVHGNQTILASSRAGSDGTLRVNFLYRTGTWVIITASKRDYVTNSVPWHSSRIPCESPSRNTFTQPPSFPLLALSAVTLSVCRAGTQSKKVLNEANGIPTAAATTLALSPPELNLNSSSFFSFSVYASVSLYLLAQRPGTLILYDDVLQVLSGSPGTAQ